MAMIAHTDWNPIKGSLQFEYAVEVSRSRKLVYGRLRAWVYSEKAHGHPEQPGRHV